MGQILFLPKRTLRIITVGESTITGVGVNTHKEGFTTTLATELARRLNFDINWKVYAKNGYTTKRIQEKIINGVPQKPVDFIVRAIGGNDAFELRSPKKWNKNVYALIISIRRKFETDPILFITIPPIKEFPAFTFTTLMKIYNWKPSGYS